MGYPSDAPTAKHDLVGPRQLVYDGPSSTGVTIKSTVQLFEEVERGVDPNWQRRLCPIYSYPDAPSSGPLARALVMVGVADTSLSAVRKILHADSLPDCVKKCTIAVKRACGDTSQLSEKDVTNSTKFANFMRELHSLNAVAVLVKDTLHRFGFVCPVSTSDSGEFLEDDFCAHLYIGDVHEVKEYLTSGPAVETKEETTNGDLWEPPGAEKESASGELWEPPSSKDTGGLWEPPASTDFEGGWQQPQVSGTKRKMSEDDEFHKDSGAAEADRFYSGLKRSLDTRADSSLLHMRSFNGWVKATQIQELNPQKKGPMSILDLACGKGGDLGKWILHDRGIRNYVGIDVARGSLVDAAIRARKMKKLETCTFTCADLGADVPGTRQKLLSWSKQKEQDIYGDPVFQMVKGGGISPGEKFDVVSIQFAIHYMMSTRKRARRFFQTVSQLLEVGGNLIATTMDARVVLDHMMDLGLDLHFDDDDDAHSEGAVVQVGGGACRIQFDGDSVKKIFTASDDDEDALFGLQYTFTLVEGTDHASGVGDAVNLPEWLTPIPVLKSLAEEAGLELVSAENFHEFYAKRSETSAFPLAHSALYNMKVLDRNGSISAEEWEISRLYVALKFRKVRESTMTMDEEENMEVESDSDEARVADDSKKEADTSGSTTKISLPPAMEAKLLPMAMMKAKKAAGVAEWATLSGDEKTRLCRIELEKLAAKTS